MRHATLKLLKVIFVWVRIAVMVVLHAVALRNKLEVTLPSVKEVAI